MITSVVGGSGSKAYQEAVRKLDARMYGRIGFLLGAALAAFFLIVAFSDMYFDKQQRYYGILVGGIVGGIIGRAIVWRRY